MNKIPKIIHYAWFGGKEIPDRDKRCIASWKKFCSDYEIRFWNESNYDYKKIDYTSQAYDNKKYAFVVDYVRLDILYQYGGIWFDTDVEVLKSFDNLLINEGFTGFEFGKSGDTEVNVGVGVGVGVGNSIIKKWLDDYTGRQFVKTDGTLNLTACPIYQTNVLIELGLKLENKLQDIDGFKIYPVDYFCPMNDITGEINVTPNTYSIHHYHASWMSDADQYRRELRTKYYKKYGKISSEILSTIVAYHKHYGLKASFEIIKKLKNKL